MTSFLKIAWTEVVQPLVRRPNHVQVAALCYRGKGQDRKVLMITSRVTKRWILPKGWPIDGLDADAAAAQEAWEEAGVRPANIEPEPLGAFEYQKRLDSGAKIACDTQVFAIEVDRLEDEFPEVDERARKWVDPKQAADMVQEPGLRAILEKF